MTTPENAPSSPRSHSSSPVTAGPSPSPLGLVSGQPPEVRFFFLAALLLLAGACFPLLAASRIHLAHARLAFAFARMPAALGASAVFFLLTGLLLARWPRAVARQQHSTLACLVFITLLLLVFWLPITLTGGFAQDDWMLLSAASIRTLVLQHPLQAFRTLDTVDGNYRPLGTVLYLTEWLPRFGTHALAYRLGNLFITLATSLTAFFLARRLGYSRLTGFAAAALFLSRGVIYIQAAWVCALGDGIAILFSALAALCVLHAQSTPRPARRVFFYAASWLAVLTACLGKQSAFAAAAFLPVLVYLRPAASAPLPRRTRLLQALLAGVAYTAPVACIFLYARTLLRGHTPYSLAFGFSGVRGFLSYFAWYFGPFELPAHNRLLTFIPPVTGLCLLVITGLLLRRVPPSRADRRNLAFLLFAALCCAALLFPLGPRIAPYYSDMFAFWLSLAFAVALTRFGAPSPANRPARLAAFLLCLLVATGFLDIRLKQIAAITSGGYIWGNLGMQQQQRQYQQIATLLHDRQPQTVVLVDFPSYTGYYASMALLADPTLRHLLVYTSADGSFLANSLGGDRPRNDPAALTDFGAYNWTLPLPAAAAAAPLLTPPATLWLGMQQDEVVVLPAAPTAPEHQVPPQP